MSHEPEEPVESLEYGRPKGEGSRGRSVGKGFALGVVAAVVGVPGMAMIGGWLDERANPDADLAGLAGLFTGGIFGLVVMAVAAVLAYVVGRRRNKPILRGAALGAFVTAGVAAISFGICVAAG